MSTIEVTPPRSVGRGVGIVCLAILALLAASAAASADYVSLALLLCLPLVPLVIYAAAQALAGAPAYASALAVGIFVVESANFRVRDYADKTIDLQVGLKLIGIALFLVLSLPTLVKHCRSGFALAPLLWITFLGYLCLTTSYAETPVYAFIAAVSLLGGFIYLWHLGETLGRQQLVRIVTASCFILCVGSIAAYVVDPSLGRMSDWNDGAFEPTSRLQGLFGTANAAGSAGAFGLLLAFLLLDVRRRSLLFAAMVGSFAICMLLSNNRMAIVAVALCLGYISLSKGNRGLKTVILLLGLSVAVILFYAFGDVLLDHMARSGSGDEVLSGTGRTRIWAVVIQLWAEHPVFGLGFTSAGQILPKNEMLFAAAAHAHNMYLEVLFSGGLVGIGLLIAALVTTIRRAAASGAHAEIGTIVFFLVYGVTEPIMSSLVGFPPLSFFLAGILAFSHQPRSETRLRSFVPREAL